MSADFLASDEFRAKLSGEAPDCKGEYVAAKRRKVYPGAEEGCIMATAFPEALVLDDDIKDRLQKLADARQKNAAELAAVAIEQYIEREEDFEREVADRLAEFDRTGLHLTNEEAMQWMDRLAAGENPKLPEPHR
jgi:predicted transcriptional regulator